MKKSAIGQKTLSSAPGMKPYALRDVMKRVFKKEQLNLDTTSLLRAVEKRIGIDDAVFNTGFRQTVSIQRKEEEIFSHDVNYGEYQALLSDAEIARRAQRLLFEPDYLDPRDLQAALLNRLRQECSVLGFLEALKSPDKAVASHKLYRKPLMAMKEHSGRWMTLRYNEKSSKNEPDAVFRMDALAEY